MFSSINKHQYLEVIEIQETYKDCLRIVIAEAVTSDSILKESSEEDPNEAPRKILNETKDISVGDGNAHYGIVFDDYIAYAETNESYA